MKLRFDFWDWKVAFIKTRIFTNLSGRRERSIFLGEKTKEIIFKIPFLMTRVFFTASDLNPINEGISFSIYATVISPHTEFLFNWDNFLSKYFSLRLQAWDQTKNTPKRKQRGKQRNGNIPKVQYHCKIRWGICPVPVFQIIL